MGFDGTMDQKWGTALDPQCIVFFYGSENDPWMLLVIWSHAPTRGGLTQRMQDMIA